MVLKGIYNTILFDVGETLLIRKPPDHEILADRCQEIGLPVDQPIARSACKQSELWVGEQALREMRGASRMPDEEFYLHLDFVALRSVFSDRMEDDLWHLATRLQAIPRRKRVWELASDAHETLTWLKEAGLRLGVVSNFDETLPDLCDRFSLTQYFDAIIVSSLVGVEKPDPEILRIACRQLGVSPLASLYVGDHPFDVLCAKEAGMSVAWLCDPVDLLPESMSCQPDYRIRSILDVLGICES